MELGMITGALLKAVIAPVASLTGKGVRAATKRLRTAIGASRKARTEGIEIRAVALAAWLGRADAKAALATPSAETMANAVRSLSWLLPDSQGGSRESNATRLIFLVLHEFLAKAEPSAATALALDWQMAAVTHEGELTRERVSEVRAAVESQATVSLAFSDNIATMPAWFQSDARALRERWPAMEVLADSLRQPGTRPQVLQDWARSHPASLASAPPEVWLWLGALASTYSEPDPARTYFLKAVEEGASPRAYWLARATTTGAVKEADLLSELRPLALDHPYPAALVAMLERDFRTARLKFEEWKAESVSDRAIKGTYLARIASQEDLSRAISIALDTYKETQSTAAGLLAAELHLTRGRQAASALRLHDTQEALRLALIVRNTRRRWGSDSAEAVRVALISAHLSGDPDLAWRLTQTPPDGEANETEAADERVLQGAALTAAMTGREERARELMAFITDPFAKAHAEAQLATKAEASGLWRAAFEAATQDSERLQAASGAADLGLPMPDLSDLASRHPEAIEEIRLVHQSMVSGPAQLQTMQANARKSRLVAVRLAKRQAADGNPTLGAETLRDAAARWRDPRLSTMAALAFWEAGLRADAVTAANDALRMGGPTWPGIGRTYAFLVQVHSAEGRWDLAEDAARHLIALDDQDVDARWALVRCLGARGNTSAAWSLLNDATVQLDPREPDEVLVWASLAVAEGPDAAFLARVLDFTGRWPDHEQVQAGLLQAVLMANVTPDVLTESQITELQGLFTSFTTKFPNSKLLWSKTVGPPEDPLAPFASDLKAKYESLHEVHELVKAASAPLGLLAAASGTSYAEISIRRSAGAVMAERAADAAPQLASILVARHGRVVLDTTSAHTLSLLETSLAEQLIGAFPVTLTTDEAFRDSIRARDSLARLSTMSAVWNPSTGKPEVSLLSETDAQRILRIAEDLRSLLEGLPRIAWPELKHFDSLKEHHDWLSALDVACEQGLAFWCDDHVLRQVAEGLNVPTFGTASLLSHLWHEGELDPALAQAALATLVHNYYVDLPFDGDVWSLAGALDGWRPGGTAFTLTRAATWSEPSVLVSLAIKAMGVVADDLSAVQGWAEATAAGLVSITDQDSEAASNLRIYLAQLLGQHWLRTQHVPVLLAGLRQRFGRRPTIEDPAETVFRDLYVELVATHGHQTAAARLFSLLALADVSDKAMAARIVLLHR